MALGLIILMYRWQVVDHEKYEQLAEAQLIEDKRLPTSRGTIYAADGTFLAVDEPVWGVYASVSSEAKERERFEKNREEFVEKISEILSLNEEELDVKLTDDFRYVPLKHAVSNNTKKEIEEADLFGITFEKEEKRVYPNGRLASHILGFVGKDEEGNDVGQYGLEGYYAGDLLGQEGFKYEEKDSRGNVIMTGEYDPVLPRQGRNIVLTILPRIQSRIEEKLKDGVEKYKAKSGSVVVLNPQTGEILAMANYPDFDPNYYWKEDDPMVFKNKAVSDVYEYGSVNKVVTVSTALQEGRITPETWCNDTTGSIKVLDRNIYTWDKNPDGNQQPKDVLKNSNNVCAVEFGLKIGIDTYYQYLKKFGIGDFIGIGLQDEATSYLMPLEYWSQVDLATASFGQMISATPLQIASAVSTIANDGQRMRPYIVKELYDDEEHIYVEPEVISQPISKDVAYSVQDMMEVVAREGEAYRFFERDAPDYSIAGKTGTAQIPLLDEYGYYDDRTNATFVGFSPVHDAKMIMVVRLEEPELEYAALTAVPLWIDIYNNIVMELGIAPGR